MSGVKQVLESLEEYADRPTPITISIWDLVAMVKGWFNPVECRAGHEYKIERDKYRDHPSTSLKKALEALYALRVAGYSDPVTHQESHGYTVTQDFLLLDENGDILVASMEYSVDRRIYRVRTICLDEKTGTYIWASHIHKGTYMAKIDVTVMTWDDYEHKIPTTKKGTGRTAFKAPAEIKSFGRYIEESIELATKEAMAYLKKLTKGGEQ